MYGYFKGVPKELEEAARIDGCGALKILKQSGMQQWMI